MDAESNSGMNSKELEQELREIKTNHLAHISADIDRINRKVDALDARLWWVLAILITATLIPWIERAIK